MHSVISICLNDRRETEEDRQLVHSDNASACTSESVSGVFGLLVVNSEMNLNGCHLTSDPGAHSEGSTRTQRASLLDDLQQVKRTQS